MVVVSKVLLVLLVLKEKLVLLVPQEQLANKVLLDHKEIRVTLVQQVLLVQL
jgi:hypothetical protein